MIDMLPDDVRVEDKLLAIGIETNQCPSPFFLGRIHD